MATTKSRKMGKNVKVDTAGKPVKVGDKMHDLHLIRKSQCSIRRKPANAYRLLPVTMQKFNGWFMTV